MSVDTQAAPARSRTKLKASSLVAIGILLSRVAGLARERVLAGYFGTSLYAEVVRAGLRMPNILQNLLGEGTLSASFIPVYAELLEQGRTREAGRVAGAIFGLLFALAGGLALLGVFLAPLLTDIFLPGFEGLKRDLTIQLTRIIFPMTGILVLSAWALGILNSHRYFFLSYFAPVLWNGAIIGTLLVLGGRLDAESLVLAFGWGAFAGGLLQFGIQLPWVLRLERSLKVSWNTRLEPVREAVRNAGPAIMGRGVVQLSGYIDFFLASLLATSGLAAIGYAQTIYILPISLFGMSVAAAELPELSRRRSSAQDVLRGRTNAGLHRIAFFIVPSSIAMLFLGDLMVGALYQTGEFDRSDTLLVYLTLIGFAIGLPASTMTRLFSSAFFALRDTRTPARIAAMRVGLAATFGFLLMTQFEPVTVFGWTLGPGLFWGLELAGQPLGAAGLALGSGIAAWIEWTLLRRILRDRIGAVGAGVSPTARMVLVALVASAAGWGGRWLLPPLHPILEALVVFGIFGLVYLAGTAALGVEEGREMINRLRTLANRRR